MSAADEHRLIAGEFTTTVEGVAPDAWDRPAPPEGWVARDVVRHLLTWFPEFLRGTQPRKAGHLVSIVYGVDYQGI